MTSYKRKNIFIIAYSILILFSFIVLIPFLFIIIHSLMPPEQIQVAYGALGQDLIKFQFWPEKVSLRQYLRVFSDGILEWYFYYNNTIVLAVPILILTLLFSVFSGYGLSKFKFRGKKKLLTIYLIFLLLPTQVMLVPFFIFFNKIDLMGSRFPLILFCTGSPFGTFLLYQFMKTIPSGSIEAARIEGANEWKIFWKIVLPQARPGVSSLIILTLIDCCSMIEQPFMLLKEKTQYPMSIMLKYLSESTIEYAFVLSVIFVFPLFLISFILQEELLTGIGFTVPQKVKK